MTGLSGAGKTTIAKQARDLLFDRGLQTEVLDGDECREYICNDLGFSKADRMENIKRLGYVGHLLSRNGIIVILCAINPYQASRYDVETKYPYVKTVWVNCTLSELIKRDPKGLYKKALLPDTHADKITNLTGVNDPYEIPEAPALILNTHQESIDESVDKLMQMIIKEVALRAEDTFVK